MTIELIVIVLITYKLIAKVTLNCIHTYLRITSILNYAASRTIVPART